MGDFTQQFAADGLGEVVIVIGHDEKAAGADQDIAPIPSIDIDLAKDRQSIDDHATGAGHLAGLRHHHDIVACRGLGTVARNIDHLARRRNAACLKLVQGGGEARAHAGCTVHATWEGIDQIGKAIDFRIA